MSRSVNYQIKKDNIKNQRESIRFYVLILGLYFTFSPFESLLTSEQGSLLKFIGGGFIFFSFLYLLLKPSSVRVSDPLVWCPLLLICVGNLSVFWTIDIGKTLHMNVTYSLLLIMFLFVYSMSYNVREINYLKKSILLGGFLISVYMLIFIPEIILQRGDGRIALKGADPNEFAALLILPLFVAFNAFLNYKNKWKIMLFAILLFIIMRTGSRGAILGIGFTFVYYIFKNFKLKKKLNYFLLIFIMLFLISLLPKFIFDRITGEGDIISTLEFGGGRSDIWSIVFNNIIPKIPILGYGSGNSSTIIGQFFDMNIGSHNTYLLLVLEYGLIGLPIFLLFLWTIFKRIKLEKDYSKIFMFIAIIIIVFFLDAYFKKYLWNILMFVVIRNKITPYSTSLTSDEQIGN